jgi:hypothetical protein
MRQADSSRERGYQEKRQHSVAPPPQPSGIAPSFTVVPPARALKAKSSGWVSTLVLFFHLLIEVAYAGFLVLSRGNTAILGVAHRYASDGHIIAELLGLLALPLAISIQVIDIPRLVTVFLGGWTEHQVCQDCTNNKHFHGFPPVAKWTLAHSII